MHEAVVDRPVVGLQIDHLGLEGVEPNAPRAVGERHRFAVLQEERAFVFRLPLGEFEEGPVVEDVAVLVDLQEAGAIVVVGRLHHSLHVLRVAVHGARHERGVGPQGDGNGVEGAVERAVGRALRDGARVGGGAVLPLREAVNLVVEEQDLRVEVAA